MPEKTPMRRQEKAMNHGEIEEFLRAQEVAHLAVRGDDGYPYVVPMNYAYHQGRFLFHSALEGKKIRALAGDSRVCLSVSHMESLVPAGASCKYGVSYTSVVAFGRGRVLEPEETLKRLQILADRFAPEASPVSPQAAQKVALIEVEVEHMTGKRG